MIVHGQCNVAAQQIEGIEFAVFVERIAGTASEGNDTGQFSRGAERSETLEKFWSDIAVRTQENRISGSVENDRAARRNERMHVLREERKKCRSGQKGESLRRRGGQQGGLVIEQKERTFARARRFHNGGQH